MNRRNFLKLSKFLPVLAVLPGMSAPPVEEVPEQIVEPKNNIGDTRFMGSPSGFKMAIWTGDGWLCTEPNNAERPEAMKWGGISTLSFHKEKS